MAKATFQRGSLTYNAAAIGVFNVSIESTYSEIDVTDTETTAGQSSFFGAKQSHTVTFDTYKDGGTADLVLNQTTSNTAVFTVDDGTTTAVYTGALVLLNKTVSGNIDGMVTLTYTGRISGALVES